MSPPSTAPSVGPPDRHTLRLLERNLATDPIVEDTAFEPDPSAPRLLRVHLDIAQYPDSTKNVRLDVRWFADGDFAIHYVESGPGEERWECRWDRHPNGHNTRLHFHEPPDCAVVSDLSLASVHPLDVYSTVLTAIEQRLEKQWAAER